MKRLIGFVLILPFLVTGCGGNEIEGRNFVSTVGYDTETNNGYKISLCFIEPDGKDMYSAAKADVVSPTAAVTDKVLSSSKRQMYFGHLKAVVIGRSAAENGNLNEILLDLSSNGDISMDTVVLCAKNSASGIISTVSNSGDGLYIWDFYKNNKERLYSTQKLTLAEAVKKLDTQKGIVIPLVDAEDENLIINGGVIFSDNVKKGEFDNNQMQGFIYVLGEGKGRNETININSEAVPFNIEKNVSNVEFYEQDGVLKASYDISFKVKRSDGFNYPEEASEILSQQIKEKCLSSVEKLQYLNCDALGIAQRLKRQDNALYNKFYSEEMFKNMVINLEIHVEEK